MDWKAARQLTWVVFNLGVACLYVVPIRLISKSWTPKLLSRHVGYMNRLADKL